MNKPLSRLLFAGMVALGVHAVFLFWQVSVAQVTTPAPLSMERIVVSLGAQSIPRQVVEKPKEDNRQAKKVFPLLPLPQEKPVKPSPARTIQEVWPIEVQNVEQLQAQEVEVLQAQPQITPEEQSLVQPERGEQATFGHTTFIVIQKATPLYQINPPPKYPRLARRRGLEGVVLFDVFVDVFGGVKELKLIQSSGYTLLDKTALKSVQRWRFTVGTIGDLKQEMWVKVPVRFKLQ